MGDRALLSRQSEKLEDGHKSVLVEAVKGKVG